MEPCEGEKGSTSISNAQPTLERRKRKHLRICPTKTTHQFTVFCTSATTQEYLKTNHARRIIDI